MKKPLVIAFCVLVAACDKLSVNPWFEETSSQAGIRFEHQSGASGSYFLPEIMGGGVAISDFDNDGDSDIYFVQSGSLENPNNSAGNALYLNDGAGTFTVSENSGSEDTGYGIGVATGDYDNDGDVDLYVTNVGANVILQNDGDATFTDQTANAGVGDEGFGSSATFADLDGDGFLDLFVVNYIDWQQESELECYDLGTGIRNYCDPSNYDRPAQDRLYRNNQDGTFTDITEEAGITRAYGNGLGVVAADFNKDGLLDVAVANDRTVNQLWINQGNMRFDDESFIWGSAMDDQGIAKAGMGIVAGDLDDDQDFDLLIVNIEGETDSYFQNERSYFKVATARVGLTQVSRGYTRFGTVLEDFNNDGLFDLYLANGRVNYSPESEVADPYAERNIFFQGTVAGRFQHVPGTWIEEPASFIHTSRAAAYGDLDNSGSVDIVVVNRDAQPYLLMNTRSPTNSWIQVRLVNQAGRDDLHAEITVETSISKKTRMVQTSGSYLAAHSPYVHVGLGESTDSVNALVRWRDGTQELFKEIELNERTVLYQGQGETTPE